MTDQGHPPGIDQGIDGRLRQIAERAMLAASDPHLEAAAYRAALVEICNLALVADAPVVPGVADDECDGFCVCAIGKRLRDRLAAARPAVPPPQEARLGGTCSECGGPLLWLAAWQGWDCPRCIRRDRDLRDDAEYAQEPSPVSGLSMDDHARIGRVVTEAIQPEQGAHDYITRGAAFVRLLQEAGYTVGAPVSGLSAKHISHLWAVMASKGVKADPDRCPLCRECLDALEKLHAAIIVPSGAQE